MIDFPPATPPLPVKITTGPHGNKTILEIGGEKVTNASSFILTASADDVTRLTITYLNVAVEVEALIDVTAMGAENKIHKNVTLKPVVPE